MAMQSPRVFWSLVHHENIGRGLNTFGEALRLLLPDLDIDADHVDVNFVSIFNHFMFITSLFLSVFVLNTHRNALEKNPKKQDKADCNESEHRRRRRRLQIRKKF
jgi:hypothetical protein